MVTKSFERSTAPCAIRIGIPCNRRLWSAGCTSSDEHFHLEFQVKCSSAGIAFNWNGTIEGRAGTLSFAFAGQAESTFKKNRIGLCLLHPIQGCAGQPCRVRETGQSWVESEFPLFISPHQPFKNLGAISWKPAPNLEATVTFAGDVFETEDQRNWTDASFKTYCTPLDQPFPAEITTGTPVHQQITFELDRTTPSSVVVSEPSSEVILSVLREKNRFLHWVWASATSTDR